MVFVTEQCNIDQLLTEMQVFNHARAEQTVWPTADVPQEAWAH